MKTDIPLIESLNPNNPDDHLSHDEQNQADAIIHRSRTTHPGEPIKSMIIYITRRIALGKLIAIRKSLDRLEYETHIKTYVIWRTDKHYPQSIYIKYVNNNAVFNPHCHESQMRTIAAFVATHLIKYI